MNTIILYVALVLSDGTLFPTDGLHDIGQRFETEAECEAYAYRMYVLTQMKYPDTIKDIAYRCEEGTQV